MCIRPAVHSINTNNGRWAKIDNAKTIDNAMGAVKLSGLMDVTNQMDAPDKSKQNQL